ncbi:MAG: hypothetical protein ACK5OC_15780 [Pirellula sp.]|jgi:hypothetical protein
MAKSEIAASEIVTLDRRTRDRRVADPADSKLKSIIANERRKNKVQRRRQIDPTTCERDYSGDEVEFMRALEQYKRTSGRMFPTCSEILEVVRSLGYARVAPSMNNKNEETKSENQETTETTLS